ncbi:MAG: hypothetical protein HQK97_04455 [Nitrospirae bacterium]|nr:hypothetical protein [Nitrospirota bacterium]
MDWLKEIEYEDLLFGDMKLIHDACGLAVLISLWENMPSMTLYLSERSLNDMKKRYILKKKNEHGFNVKEIDLMLKVTESFVYSVLRSDDIDERQGKLFG